jgi:hypothetical protein
MTLSPRVLDSLKRKLRRLKQHEIAIRFGRRPRPAQARLVWEVFFSTRANAPDGVKYPLAELARLTPAALEAVIEEYFYRVYYQHCIENGLRPADVHDPQLLRLMGLPPHAGLAEIKRRFRELAKRHHPDHGGEAEQFIALMAVYEQLTET